jgi:hypothetical protein
MRFRPAVQLLDDLYESKTGVHAAVALPHAGASHVEIIPSIYRYKVLLIY